MDCLECVLLDNNPLSGDLNALYKNKNGVKGWNDLKSYLKQGLDEGVEKSTRVRLLVLGHEECGKSSLIDSVTLPLGWTEAIANNLGKNHLVESRSKTNRTWKVEPREWSHEGVSFGILDFPGQSEFYATNQFFFSSMKESVLILVVRLCPTSWTLKQANGDAVREQQLKSNQLEKSSDQLRFWLQVLSDHISRTNSDQNDSADNSNEGDKEEPKQKVLIVATCGDSVSDKDRDEWLSDQKSLSEDFPLIDIPIITVVNALDRNDVESVRNLISNQAKQIISNRLWLSLPSFFSNHHAILFLLVLTVYFYYYYFFQF